MQRDPDCLFCKIVAGEIPCHRVYEDDATMAFLDINPVKPGHALVIPKAHHPTLLETPAELAEPLLLAVQRVAAGVMAAVEAQGFNTGVNTHTAAGQLVPHVHFHVIPRHEDDGLSLWGQKPYPNDQAMADMAQAVRSRVNPAGAAS